MNPRDYNDNSLDPEVVEFYRLNRSKNSRCHSHHHAHQQHIQRVHVAHTSSQPQPHQAAFIHTRPTCVGANTQLQQTTNIPVTTKVAQHAVLSQQRMGNSEHIHHHQIQRYRSSVSPVQALSSTCGNSANTLNSSSGYCTASSASLTSSNVIHSSGKPAKNLRAVDLLKLLREKVALLPGGRSRRGGPILCFLSNSRAHEIAFEDLCLLVWYLTYLPEMRVKSLGFTVIVDMRNGTTWNSVKPILKVVDKCIGRNVNVLFIIKPDKLFEKHKANMSVNKFSFDVQLVSIDALFREVDASQLTAELEGSLPYHHEEWIRIRCCLEEFYYSAHDMSDKFGHLFHLLERKSEGDTVEGVKLAREEHKALRSKIVQAPVSALDTEAERLVTWLRYGITAANSISGASSTGQSSVSSAAQGASTGAASGSGGASFLATSWVSMNPDFQQLIPQVQLTVTKLYEYRALLQQKWEAGRSYLEQMHQLRLFQDDANQMACWLDRLRQLFLTEYLDIGHTASHAADLLSEHRQFVNSCSVAFEQIGRLNGVAAVLADVGHFASPQLLKLAGKLEHQWKSFAAALEDRSRVLYLSASFHDRAQSFLANCPHRESAMMKVTGNTVHELNQALLTLQNYWQEAQSAREEVCEDGRALIDHLSAPVPTGSHTSLTAAVDYSQGRDHCTDLVHEIWAWFKKLECVYNERKTHLNSRLSLLMFEEDVDQVLAWLSDHGEPFLQRQTSVGKSVVRAEQLYNTHMQFELVAAKTLVNAEKLISVADDLAGQADDPRQIVQRASELQRRISAFTRAVESRRETVDLGCGFYGHTKEVFAWLHGVREGHNAGEHLPATIEGMEDELTHFHRDRTAIEEGADRVVSEGEALIARLKDPEEVAHIRSVLSQVSSERSAVSTLLMERQVRLDLCLQLRLFEADVHSTLDCLRHSVPSFPGLLSSRTDSMSSTIMSTTPSVTTAAGPLSANAARHASWVGEPKQAPDIGSLEEVTTICMTVLPTAEEVLHKGGELVRAFESVGVNFPAGGPGSSDSGVGDSVETAMERVHRLNNELSDAVATVDDLNDRVSAELDWRRLQVQSKQVLQWISQCDDILRDTAAIPANLTEAQALQAEHEKFQPVLNDAHPQAVQCTARAGILSTQTTSTGTEHPRRKECRAVAEVLAEQWQKLVYAAEDRHKLLIAATNWYKTSDQVTSVLRSLEKEYHREEDWCQTDKGGTQVDVFLNQLSSKHAEQKEAFLKACMLARRTSDVFSRYLHRQPPSTKGRSQVEEKIRAVMAELMAKEQAVLEAWAVRRRRLDDCTYFINIKHQVEDLLTRVRNQSKGPSTLVDSTQLGSSLIQEVNRACDILQSMIASSMPLSPNHTTQLTLLVKRLHATLPHQFTLDASSVKGVSAATAGGVGGSELGATARSHGDQRKLSAPTYLGGRAGATAELPLHRLKRPEGDPDRTSVSSTSSSGAGSSNATASDMFLSGANVCSSAGSVSAAGATGPSHEQRRVIRRRENLLRELIQTERTYVQSLEHCLDTYRNALVHPPKPLEQRVPANLVELVDVLFGNMPAIYAFHKQTFEPELGKYTESGNFLPEDVGHCFVVHSERLAELYVNYCVNYTESTRVMIEHGQSYFQAVQRHSNMTEPLPSFLIKPVQRVTKYQLLLRELCDCCDPGSVAELNEGLEAMLDVPKRANDALHLNMLQNLPDDIPIASLGDVILQDQFTVTEPKQLIKKSRERRIFLFDNGLIVAKECLTQPGEHKSRYNYKSRVLLAECNITEHIEGDQCKFALWTGRVPPIHEYRMILKASSLELKQTWVRALRELMRERMFSVQTLYQHQQQQQPTNSGDKPGLFSDEAELLETHYILENYQASKPSEVSVSAHQIVQVLHRCTSPRLPESPITAESPGNNRPTEATVATFDPTATGDWAYIRMLVSQETGTKTAASAVQEGFIPVRLIGAPSGRQRRRSSVQGGQRRASAGGRKWLPSAAGSERIRNGPGQGLLSGKRGSKVELNQTIITPYPTTSRVVSNERQTASTSAQLNAKSTEVANTILDNVSEESIDVELPPPMEELQVHPATTAASAEVDQETITTTDEPAMDERTKRQVDNRKSSVERANGSAQGTEWNGADKPAVNNHQRVATVLEVAGGCRMDTMVGSNPTAPNLVGLPNGANLSGLGDLRLHGGLSVAAKLVAASRPTPTAGCATSTSALDEEEMLRGVLEEGAELHFINRYLFLYDQALVIADAAVELRAHETDTDSVVQCHFRHALPISQISILEDVGVPGSKPIGDQLLWFCLSERARTMARPMFDTNSTVPLATTQSYLCYIVAPRTPDTRIRWLTELSAMVMEARRQSQAFITAAPSSPTSDGAGSQGGIGTNNHLGGYIDNTLSGQQNKLSSVAAAALYPSGMLFDPNFLELHRLGRLVSPGTLNPNSSKCRTISTSPPVTNKIDPIPISMLDGLHLTATSTS